MLNGHIIDTHNTELINQINNCHKKLMLKDMATGVFVDAMAVMDLDPLITYDYIANTLTASCMDSTGKGTVRRMRYMAQATDDAEILLKHGIYPYHCIYDAVSDTNYFLALDLAAETDEEFFLQVVGYITHVTDLGNDANLVWVDNGVIKTGRHDIDVHDGVFYIVDHYPGLRDADGITHADRIAKIIKYIPARYPWENEYVDYGETFKTGDPIYDRVYEASNRLI